MGFLLNEIHSNTGRAEIVLLIFPKANEEFDFPELLTASLNLPRKCLDDKPSKPHPDFPLTANGKGQRSKKIRGKVHYFGSWANPNGVLLRYLEVKDDLLAGSQPKPKEGFYYSRPCKLLPNSEGAVARFTRNRCENL